MKAAILQAPGVVIIAEVPEPTINDYEALCVMKTASICSGTDNHARDFDPFFNIQPPSLFGHEGIGEVVAIGAKVTNLQIGDLVTRVINRQRDFSNHQVKEGWGSFAEKGVAVDWQAMKADGLPEKEWRPFTFHRTVPNGIDPVAATMIITWRETRAFFNRFDLQTKDRLLIIGSGGNALSFATHALHDSLRVGVIGNPNRAAQFSQVGVQNYFSYQDKDLVSTLQKSGFDKTEALLDAVGRHESVNTLLPLLAQNGTLGVYGLDDHEQYTVHPTHTRGDFHFLSGTEYEEGSTHDDIIKKIQAGKLQAWDFLSKEHLYPFDRIEDALRATKERKTFKSVIVF